MSISSINGVNGYTAVKTAETEKTAKAAETTKDQVKDDGVVFEKSNETKKDSANQIYNKDNVIAKLKADQQSRLDSMNSLVQKLLGKQAEKFDLANGSNLAETFRQVAGKVDQQTIDEAKASVAEDGYWGVNQTSDRLVSMAIALAGGDTDKADTMMAAIEKGYKQATKAWGEDLPQICQDTMDATRQKMDDWKNGVTTAEDYSKYLS
ncbi:MAG: hypothetical protein BHW06_12110 [Clostridium sp. 44_14]|nr:MAG: hypothetical protein BHW06_12110 [Clostridium sp. 44_14]